MGVERTTIKRTGDGLPPRFDCPLARGLDATEGPVFPGPTLVVAGWQDSIVGTRRLRTCSTTIRGRLWRCWTVPDTRSHTNSRGFCQA